MAVPGPISTRTVTEILSSVERSILGKARETRLALACLLAGGHLLIEDIPGIGKTTLARALSTALGLDFKRVQFTNDLLPGDIVGASIFDRDTGRFVFHEGPVFTSILLADEINRATPRTQSALLEAMEERQVTVEGQARPLPEPFFVIATQNPQEQAGTFPLPESQLDRFLLRISLGYPGRDAETLLLNRDQAWTGAPLPQAVTTPQKVRELQDIVAAIHASKPLIAYVLDLLEATRHNDRIQTGLSPRAGLGILQAARAWALLQGRDHALPEDVQAVFSHVAGHRLKGPDLRELSAGDLTDILHSVPLP
ncbi:MAG: MoxR family ATPase [Deltaproteobacteria bacterium]|nr:MoxR family ATPase [Deltaproteobacteria bacterium]